MATILLNKTQKCLPGGFRMLKMPKWLMIPLVWPVLNLDGPRCIFHLIAICACSLGGEALMYICSQRCTSPSMLHKCTRSQI